MKFKTDIYLQDMKTMVDKAVARLQEELPEFEIFTASIWTDPNGAISTISFDNKSNSDLMTERVNAWNKSHYEKHVADGDMDQAMLFDEVLTRNCNPADFELRNLETVNHLNFPHNWEEKSEGDCWDLLEPALKETGNYAFGKLAALKHHADFELGVNGSQDWYEFTWPKK